MNQREHQSIKHTKSAIDGGHADHLKPDTHAKFEVDQGFT